MATVGTVVIDIKADTAKLVDGMQRAEKAVKGSVDRMKKMVIGLATAYASIQSVRAFHGMVTDAIDAADRLGELAQKLGATTEELSKLEYAAKYSGVSVGKLEAGLSAMIRRINNFQRTGGGAAAQALKELGISAEFARENFTSTQRAFEIIADRLAKLPDGYKKTAIAQDIFSKSAADMLRVASMGSAELKRMFDEAERFGVVIPQSVADMAAAYNDMLGRLGDGFDGIKKTISYSILPSLVALGRTAEKYLFEAFASGRDGAKSFAKASVAAIKQIIGGVGFLKDSLTGIELVLKTIKLGFYYLVYGIDKAFNFVREKFNSVIRWYNSLPEWLVGKHRKIETYQLWDTSGLERSIASTKSEIVELAHSLTKGRESAAEFAKEFEKQLKIVEKEAKSASKSTKNSFKDTVDQIRKNLSQTSGAQKEVVNLWQKNNHELIMTFTSTWGAAGKTIKQETKKTVDYVETTFDKATKNIYKSFDDNFFDLITGKFHDFKSFLRSLFDDILHGIVNPFARALSGAIAGGLGSFVGLPKISVASIASQLGLKDAGDKFVGMVNGTEVSISKSGEILSGGNALPSDAVNLLSTVKSGYTLATGSAAGGLYSIGNSLYTAGYTNSGMAFIGAGNWISGAGTSGLTTAGQIGYYGGGALIGAGMGYGIGTLGDMLFGADTKAALYGAIGGALGGTILPMIFTSLTGPLGAFIGSVVGSVTGGLFGKWKTQEVGKQINTLLTEGSIDSSAITDYAYNKKKNWFHTKKRWKDLGIDQEDLFAIRKLFAAYNETLKRFGSELEITLEKGRLKIDKNSNEFDEYISKEFIKNLMGLDKSISKLKPIFEGHYKEFGGETLYLVERFAKSRMKWIDNAIAKAATQAEKDELIKAKEDLGRVKEVYEAWKAYAKKQEKSVSEAIVEAFKGLESLDDTFKKINYEFAGLNGGAIIQTQNAITILKTGLSDLSDFLGKDIPYRVGMSVEEFKQLEEAVLKASPTPEAIGALERFGGAIAEVARAANSVKLDYYKTYKPDVYDEKAKKLLVSSFTESMKQTVGEETWKKMQKAGITFETPEDIVKFVETTVGNDEKGIKKYTVYKDGKKTTIDENTLLAVTAPYYYEAKKMSGKPLPQQPHATKDEPKKSYAPTPVEARYSTYSIASEIDKYLYTRGRSGIDALKAQVEWAKRYKKELFAALHVGGWTLETLNEYLKKHKDLSAKDLEKVRKIKEALVELDSAERMYNEALEQRKAQIAQQWQSLLDAVQASKIRKKVDELNKAIESLSDKLSSLKGASSTLDSLIDRFTSKLESPAEREAKFYSFLDLAKSALAAQNYADYNAYLQKASKYADFVEGKQYSSSAEKRWEIARIANELKDLKSPTDLMIERLDRMIEQNRQIIDATQGSKDSLYELVNVKIGGKTFEEITKDGLIQGIKSPDFTAIVGDNLDAISSELTGAGAYFKNIRLQDGKTLSLVDFDQDGRTDLTLAFDASGKLTGIQQNTKALLDLQVQELTRATKQLYAINAAPDYLKNYVATRYNADYDYVKTQQGQLEYNFIVPLEQTAVSLLKHLNSGQLNADLAATIRGEAYQIQSLAKILSDNGLGGKSVWLDSNHHYVSDLLDYYSYIDQLLKNRGFATGGYTGDYPTDAPVGVVHGQEFVLNAETTRNLGLNKDGGGVFVEILAEMKRMRAEMERLRSENAQLQAQIARNTEPIATAQRWER